MKLKIPLFTLLLVFFVICAGISMPVRKTVVVLIPAVTLDDMTSHMPTFRMLIRKGAVGIMNTRSASPDEDKMDFGKITFHTLDGRSSLESAYVTLGAGSRAISGKEGGQAANTDEKTEFGITRDVFTRRTGQNPGSAKILHLSVGSLLTANSKLSYAVIPGKLGEELHKAGLKTACIGNSDTLDGMHRESVCLAMDQFGRVDVGDISKRMLSRDPAYPEGVKTNIPQMMRVLKETLPKTDLIVLETGDTSRLDRMVPLMKKERIPSQMTLCLQSADNILTGVLSQIDLRKDLLIVITPNTSRKGWTAGNRLAPVLIAGNGISQGILKSASTRTEGLLTNTDIAPTILAGWGLKIPGTLVGRPVEVIPTSQALQKLHQFSFNQKMLSAKQGVIPRSFTWVAFGLFLLGSLLILFCPAILNQKIVSILCLLPAALPTGMLLTGALPASSVSTAVLVVTGISLGLTLFAVFLPIRRSRAVGLLAVVFTIVCVWDMMQGGIWTKNSVFGYSANEGARYYGIGNEYMGYLIGSSLLVCGLIMERMRKLKLPGLVICAFILGVSTFAIGLPQMGANSGGAIAAAAGSASAILLLAGARLNKKNILIIFLSVFVVLGGIVALDLSRSTGSQSHIAHAVKAIGSGGSGEAFSIIFRKLAMNIKLMKFSPSSRLMFLGIILTIWLFNRLKSALSNQNHLNEGFVASLIGAGAALVFNDSGVLAAANGLVFMVAALIALEMDNPGKALSLQEQSWVHSIKSLQKRLETGEN